jgi:ATP-dependent helicase/DNAse subunit B
VLEATYRRMHEETGSARVTHATLDEAERILLEELDSQRELFPISPKEARARTAVRKLEFDLLRHLRREAETGGDFEPADLELSFGADGREPLRLEPEGVAIRGRIDRVDVRDGHALVVDYKSGKKGYPVARWEEDRRLQVALYMLAVRELLALEPVGGVYVPLANPDEGPRGLLLQGEVAEGAFKKPDVRSREEFEEALRGARERVCELAARMRAGEVRPCPDTCAWNGGCSHPSICRVEKR